MNQHQIGLTYLVVLFLGLAILSFTGFWFPGILYVLGGSMIVKHVLNKHEISSYIAPILLLGIAVFHPYIELLISSHLVAIAGGSPATFLFILVGLYYLMRILIFKK
ncbi:hypothetical protein DID75_04715 [Candidatus Marinamargulisbacteria bacterium SCGC AG-410-N11]|nr:hypothetical protein DID75_04715 [Candidatus Marinamargulisbacteria bacterium SCGC AG-410-N11]